LFLKVGPVSNRTIPIKSGYTSLSVLNLLFSQKRPRVDCYSECCFSCFLSITYENSSLSFLFFMTGIERIATKDLMVPKRTIVKERMTAENAIFVDMTMGCYYSEKILKIAPDIPQLAIHQINQ